MSARARYTAFSKPATKYNSVPLLILRSGIFILAMNEDLSYNKSKDIHNKEV